MRYISPRERLKKMDIMFYNSIKSIKFKYEKSVALHVFNLIIIFIVNKNDVISSEHDKIMTFFSLALILSLLSTIIYSFIVKKGFEDFQAIKGLLQIAEHTNHICHEEVVPRQEQSRLLKDYVSHNMYIANQLRDNNPDLTIQIRKKYQQSYSKLIQQELERKDPDLFNMGVLVKGLNLIIFIQGIRSMITTNNPHLSELLAMVICLILLAWENLILIAGLLFILFLPLIGCLVCFFIIFSGNNADRNNLSIPEPVDATARIVEQTNGSCMVCLQNFALGQRVIVLRCSRNHVFHENCILTWLRVSNSCPICRSPITQPI